MANILQEVFNGKEVFEARMKQAKEYMDRIFRSELNDEQAGQVTNEIVKILHDKKVDAKFIEKVSGTATSIIEIGAKDEEGGFRSEVLYCASEIAVAAFEGATLAGKYKIADDFSKKIFYGDPELNTANIYAIESMCDIAVVFNNESLFAEIGGQYRNSVNKFTATTLQLASRAIRSANRKISNPIDTAKRAVDVIENISEVAPKAAYSTLFSLISDMSVAVSNNTEKENYSMALNAMVGLIENNPQSYDFINNDKLVAKVSDTKITFNGAPEKELRSKISETVVKVKKAGAKKIKNDLRHPSI